MSLKLQSIASVLAVASFRPDEKVKPHILQCPVLEEKLLADLRGEGPQWSDEGRAGASLGLLLPPT